MQRIDVPKPGQTSTYSNLVSGPVLVQRLGVVDVSTRLERGRTTSWH